MVLGVISALKIDDFLNSVRSLENSGEFRKGLVVWGWAELQVSLREPPEAWAERTGGTREAGHCLCGQSMWLTCGHLKLSKPKAELIHSSSSLLPLKQESTDFPSQICRVTLESLGPQAL